MGVVQNLRVIYCRLLKSLKMANFQRILFTVFILVLFHNSAVAAIRYVDQANGNAAPNGSIANPFPTIQEAVNASITGDEIRVARGQYSENILINNKILLIKGAYEGGSTADYSNSIPGNFSSQDYIEYISIIEGNSASPVIELRLETSGSLIDGFVITGGHRGILFDTEFTWPASENIIISNNTIENNGWDELNDQSGGGIRITGNGILVENNIIRNNRAGRGGALSVIGQNNVIRGNTIDDNWANSDHGGGLYLFGNVLVENNIISNNRVGVLAGYGWGGGAIFLETGNDMAISRYNIYINNMAPTYAGGVFADEAATLMMSHDLVIRNYTQSASHGGGGIAVDRRWDNESSQLIVNHCTVAYNYSTQGSSGNGIYVDQLSNAVVENSIFYENGGDFTVSGNSTFSMTYSISDDVVAGSGNLQDDPLFADPDMDDFHLKSMGGRYEDGIWVTDTEHSPAIDAANPASSYEMESSPNGERANLGCYGNTPEASRSYSTVLSADISYFKARQNNQQIELSWETSNEYNSDYFIVKKSPDAVRFHKIGELKAEGNSNKARKYSIIDQQPSAGSNFYMLEELDNSQNTQRSQIIEVWFDPMNGILVYPTVTKDLVNIQIKDHDAKLNLIDSRGIVVRSYNAYPPSAQIDISDLPESSYFLQVVTRTGMYVYRIMKL
jgi:hypothetical protein